MARSVNQVTLMGNLTRDPELRQTPSGQSVCSFSLALNRAYKDQSGEWQEATDYIDCVCWGPLAERVSQYLSKGRRALVQGRLQSRSWEQEGQKRSKVEVLANDVTFLDGRGEGGGSADDRPSRTTGEARSAAPSKKKDEPAGNDFGDEPINLDDIPF
ncbi:MAG TPA: single-stranded DNA-binding protein [Candidatus Saccharimonadales bacterium]|nr:single-stranded DNA-binding protein [Candidatus Saccharimonadales bacterium]